jgi:hypothetical protein
VGIIIFLRLARSKRSPKITGISYYQIAPGVNFCPDFHHPKDVGNPAAEDLIQILTGFSQTATDIFAFGADQLRKTFNL